MDRGSLVVAALALVFALPARASVDDAVKKHSDPDQHARSFEENWLKAFAAGDLKAVAELYADEAVLVGPDGTVARGREEIQRLLGAVPHAGRQLTLEDASGIPLGDDALAVVATWKARGEEAPRGRRGATTEPVRTVSTATLVKIGGKWRIRVEQMGGHGGARAEARTGGADGRPPPPRSGAR